MDKIKFDKTYTIKVLSVLEDGKFIGVLLDLLNKRTEIIGHFNENQILDIDIVDFDKDIQYNISSKSWYESLKFFPEGNLTPDHSNLVHIGENLMICDFVCKATRKNHLIPKLSDKILINFQDDKFQEYFTKIIS